MGSITTYRDRQTVQKLPFCYMCGVPFRDEERRSRDHVPPKTCFAKRAHPDTVAATMARLSDGGVSALALGFANYLKQFPYFRDEVLPRLERIGLRVPAD